MTKSNATAKTHGARRIGIGLAFALIVAVCAYLFWPTPPTGAPVKRETQSAPAATAAQPVNYPAPGKETSAQTEFPAGAKAVSGPEIVAALSDHTALLPGGFVEYYAPDGSLHGQAEEKHYGGRWEVRNGTFCTLLQDSDSTLCSPVERAGNTLYWSMDGDPQASPVSMLPGNPRNLQ